ncbi:nucleoporin Nup37-like [Babylonia areolata]|uniref:nucleoporin Nup37-like n=1 Tax=Babylonia areolata TaxID=304850 RepID=UPI003FD5969D
MKDDVKSSTYSIPCQEVVRCVEFSPFQWSCQLLAFGTATKVSVVSCRFQEEDVDLQGLDYSAVKDVQMDHGVACLAWSPKTSISMLDKHLCFAAACDDHNVRVFTSDLKETNSTQVLKGHTDFVNAVTFNPNEEDQLASTGDDLTCRVWSGGEGDSAVLKLTAPGMSVCWHCDDPLKLMVAQKDGIIRFFSLSNQQPIKSLSCGVSPLMDCDWSKHNYLLVGAVAGSDWIVFDTASSSTLDKRQAHVEGARSFRWSRSHESLLATLGRPNRQIKVFNTLHQQLHVSVTLPVAYGLSWHCALPVLAVGGDRRVHFWVVEST